MNELKTKRAYANPETQDGYRILIDRLWPRGISKDKAAIDEWAKTIAPTTELRRWFGHKEENYAVFATRYCEELSHNADALPFASHVAKLLAHANVTLVYGAKSSTCNHAIILRDWLLCHFPETKE